MTLDERKTFLYWLARGYHPQMEPESVAYLLDHFGRAMIKSNIKTFVPEDLLDAK